MSSTPLAVAVSRGRLAAVRIQRRAYLALLIGSFLSLSRVSTVHKLLKSQTKCLDAHPTVASVALFIYDYFITQGLEIELVWSAPWNPLKVMYLIQRYLPFADTVFLVVCMWEAPCCCPYLTNLNSSTHPRP